MKKNTTHDTPYEYIVNAHAPTQKRVDPNPPQPKSGLDLLADAHAQSKTVAAAAAPTPSQKVVNEMFIRYWRGEGPRPKRGLTYRDLDPEQEPEGASTS
jgi:hypothetical protein